MKKVSVYRKYVGLDGTITLVFSLDEVIPEADDVRISGDIITWYKDCNIHKLYKTYKICEGEYCEIKEVCCSCGEHK